MEQNKKIFSTILLSVGVLFIIVSGAIFISQTWSFLPDELKKICLFLVTALMFTGSAVTEMKWNLRKSSLALYYLGTFFTGYSILSVCMYFETGLTFTISAALLGMLLPVTLHYVRTRNAFDFLLEVLLADGLLFCLFTDLNVSCLDTILFPASAVSLALSGFLYYLQKEHQESDSTFWIAWSFYGVHSIFVLLSSLPKLFDDNFIYLNAIAVGMVLASLSVLYMIYQNTLVRVMQSVLMSYFVLVLMNCLRALLFDDNLLLMFFLAFAGNVLIMAALNRKEMVIINAVVTMLFVFFLMFLFILCTAFSGTYDKYYPYATVFAAGCLLKVFLSKEKYDWKELTKWCTSFVALDICLGISAFREAFALDNCFLMVLSIVCLQLGMFFKKYEVVQSLARVFALCFFLVNFIANPILPVKFYTAKGPVIDFTVEHACILIGLGIVLFGIIWYHKCKTVRMLQFVGLCTELAFLLFYNINMESLPNILFLGIASFLCLLVSAGLKFKNYTIAFALTLVLIVLYLTKAVWMSIAWWVYLFIAGMVLVFFAIRREKAE